MLVRERLASLKQLGLVPAEVKAPAGNILARDWETLSAAEKRDHARDMEVYAAMVEYMDMSIGWLLAYLQANGLYDNTLIVFFSDNGANGAQATAYPGNADGSYLETFNRLRVSEWCRFVCHKAAQQDPLLGLSFYR